MLLLILDWNSYFQQWKCPNAELEESISETRGDRIKHILDPIVQN